MDFPFKRTLIFIAFFAAMNSTQAFNIGAKGRVNGPAIHSTYFYTPNNAAFTVHGQAYVGTLMNGQCRYAGAYDIGTEVLQTGDVIDIDAFQLKSLVGSGFSCMTIFYKYRQVVRDSFTLFFDGINYSTTGPATDQVTIL